LGPKVPTNPYYTPTLLPKKKWRCFRQKTLFLLNLLRDFKPKIYSRDLLSVENADFFFQTFDYKMPCICGTNVLLGMIKTLWKVFHQKIFLEVGQLQYSYRPNLVILDSSLKMLTSAEISANRPNGRGYGHKFSGDETWYIKVFSYQIWGF
jgi:hypothetical protein